MCFKHPTICHHCAQYKIGVMLRCFPFETQAHLSIAKEDFGRAQLMECIVLCAFAAMSQEDTGLDPVISFVILRTHRLELLLSAPCCLPARANRRPDVVGDEVWCWVECNALVRFVDEIVAHSLLDFLLHASQARVMQ